MAITKRKIDYVHAAGGVMYASQLLADGTYGGWFDLGNTPAFSIAVEGTPFVHYSADDIVRQQVISNITDINRTATITVDDMHEKNLARFIIGKVAPIAQASGAVADESVNGGKALEEDLSYQLGESVNRVGARAITSIVVKDSETEPVTYVKGTDYEEDLELGMIRVIPGGGLVGKTGVKVSYTRPAATIGNVETDGESVFVGRVKFVAKAAAGKQVDLHAPNVRLMPTGELAMKNREAAMSMTFNATFLEGTAGEPAIQFVERAVVTP